LGLDIDLEGSPVHGAVDERQPVWFLAHPGLAVAPPDPPLHHHIIATGFGCQQRFF
jgi:hypothetical protein